MTNKRIAIVYDWIDKWGGVERILLILHEMFPQAEFFTSYYDRDKAPWVKDLKIKTSFIQKFPDFIKKSRILSFTLYPYAFEAFDFRGYDLVISVTSSFAKAIITRPETKHICYLLTPTRYLWVSPDLYLNKPIKFLLSSYLTKLREWDFVAAWRPDNIISISKTVADRCKKYYKRDSRVIYPPFDQMYWLYIKDQILKIKTTNQKLKISREKPFYLVVSRLEPYKKVELVLQYVNKLKQNVVVVGEGSELQRLKELARENVSFFSKLTDEELGYLYTNAEALIMPEEEDFGYVSLEAQFFGCPIIAYKKGGATETIIEGKTGLFFDSQTEQSLREALKRFNMIKYALKRSIVRFGQVNVEKFSKEKFVQDFEELIKSKIKT
ncbi:glycosyltransferase [Candidatus Roizmanbacteria bacterium]|nr:glycosyltransferase [Candidatus Roizmanbacteria bacterium]